MKRRKFLGNILLGTLISYLTSFWHKSSSLVRANNVKQSNNYVSVGKLTQLKKEGNILNEDSPVGAILIMYDSKNSVIAVDPTCTHAGCIVEWKDNKNSFICPCHSSRFGITGEVIKSEGPARFPLKNYSVKIEGDSILVKPS